MVQFNDRIDIRTIAAYGADRTKVYNEFCITETSSPQRCDQ